MDFNSGSGDIADNDIEMMGQIAFLIKESGMGFNEVIELPYSIFLSLLKHFQLNYLRKDPNYVQAMERDKILKVVEPQWDRLEPLIKRVRINGSN
jgi:hypothetical protein